VRGAGPCSRLGVASLGCRWAGWGSLGRGKWGGVPEGRLFSASHSPPSPSDPWGKEGSPGVWSGDTPTRGQAGVVEGSSVTGTYALLPSTPRHERGNPHNHLAVPSRHPGGRRNQIYCTSAQQAVDSCHVCMRRTGRSRGYRRNRPPNTCRKPAVGRCTCRQTLGQWSSLLPPSDWAWASAPAQQNTVNILIGRTHVYI
jgi:hypothetical protein